ncbi:MAG: ACP S-malonyltransferase, partial [Lentisphaerae bacterium]|nr:ACP S-malonyltransferase [Lentisphaerota bacterium]
MQTELCLFSAESRNDLIARAEAAERELRAAPEAPLRAVAAKLAAAWQPDAACLSVVAGSADELARKLAHAAKRLREPERTRLQDRSGIYYYDEPLARGGRTAFLFPGEGAQYANMLRDVCASFPEARRPFDLADRACREAAGDFLPSAHVFPAGAAEADADASLWGMEEAIEAVVGADTALLELTRRLQIRPDAAVGHSSGELVAVEAAGAVRYADDAARVESLKAGYQLMRTLTRREGVPEGILLTAGGIERSVIDAHLARFTGDLLLAMDNCPHQYIVCARPAVADAVERGLMEAGAIVTRLPFARPYHTSWFEPVLDAIRGYLDGFTLEPPAVPFYSCATADVFPDDPAKVRDLCVAQWAQPVRFRETVEKMYADGVRVFV